ncbi:MAG: hypothetical protein HY298_13300 [Verrucomicrobia bacterium]|nr:hypothetical protein [Verrucomicrobiota bacterium]
MSAQEVIEQIKHLPPAERAQVTKFVVESDDSWIPEEFKQGMADIAAGRVVDLDAAMTAMANDPQIQRELRSINTEFAAAESDGLGKL